MMCIYEFCDQMPLYCEGHYQEMCSIANRQNDVIQSAGLIIRALLIRLEREGISNADMAAARDWLK